MAQQGCWRRWLGACSLAAGLLAASGCLCFVHPIDPACPELTEPCRMLPKCARDHVHVLFVHGMDPVDCANLSGVRDYVQALGFQKTYYGQLYHVWQFKKLVRDIHQHDCDSRFVLVGFSFGANMVRTVAQAAGEDGIPIDLLIYLGGNTMKNTPKDQPENVERIVNILAQGCIWNGDTLDQAENVQIKGRWHFGSPSHPFTLQVLAQDLAEIASSVLVPVPAQREMPAWDEPAPRPRKLESRKPAARDEWDFLKPVSHLGEQPYPEPAPVNAPRTASRR